MCTDIKDGVGSFDFNDRTFGNLVWPVEEIFFLRSIASKNDDWIEKFLVSTYNDIPMEMLSDLIKLQSISTIAPEDTERTENLQFDLVALLDEYDSSNNWSPKLPINQNLQVRRKSVVEFHTLEEYAREVVWYGRKGTAMEYELEVAK
jgi:hypothetical protein